MHKYYPIALNMKGKKCLLIGGGNVAYRKVMHLLQCGADVKVVAPGVIDGIKRLAQKGRIKLVKRTYKQSDLKGMYLVYAATDDNAVNKKVFHSTRSMHTLVNVVDKPASCDFIMPAVLRRGKITITISTEGAAPYASVLLKKRIDELITREYIKLINTIIRARKRLLNRKRSGIDINIEQVLKKISLKRLAGYIKDKDNMAMNHYIDDIVLSSEINYLKK